MAMFRSSIPWNAAICSTLASATRSSWHSLSFPTASKAVQTLVGLGLVHELTGQRRNRVFVYSVYLAILNEGGEPL